MVYSIKNNGKSFINEQENTMSKENLMLFIYSTINKNQIEILFDCNKIINEL